MARVVDTFIRAADTAAAAVRRVADASLQPLVVDAAQAALRRAPTADEALQLGTKARLLARQGASEERIRRALALELSGRPEAMLMARVDGAVQSALGRAETQGAWHEEARRLLGEGRTLDEVVSQLTAQLVATPEARKVHADEVSVDVAQRLLGRPPSQEELDRARPLVHQWIDEGKSPDEVRAGLEFVTALGNEYRKLHAADPVNAAYARELGHPPSPEELARCVELVHRLIDEGKGFGDVDAAMSYVIALSPEWQALHRPAMSLDRDALYLQQPNGWTCGPTSLAMALAAAGVRPASQDTVWDLVDALGARAGVGTPGSAALIADVARQAGVNAEYSPSREPGDVRAALAEGKGVVVNGDLGGGGHFLYLAGLDEAGDYIVLDPWRPGISRWGDAELWEFTHHGSNPPGFAAIWPA